MEALPRLEARLSSLGELRDIIRALRAMAASRVQEAQGALPGIRQYGSVVENAITETAVLTEGETVVAMGERNPERRNRPVLILVTSEHGFVGGFNETLMERLAGEVRPEHDLLIIGARGAALAVERGMPAAHTHPMATHVGGVLTTARAIADHLSDAADVAVIFARYVQGGGSAPALKRILPIDPALMAGTTRRLPPLHHLPPVLLMEQLAQEYLFAGITDAVMESLVSENAARLRAMEAADRNIGDRLDRFAAAARALRQDAITSELFDVVAGSEAILSAGKA